MAIFGNRGGKMLSHIAISLRPISCMCESMHVRMHVFWTSLGLSLFRFPEEKTPTSSITVQVYT